MPSLSELKEANRVACERMDSIMAASHGRSMTPAEREGFDKATTEAEASAAEIDRFSAAGNAGHGKPRGPDDDASGYLTAYLAARANAVSGKGATRGAAQANMRAQLERDGVVSPTAAEAGPSPQASMRRLLGLGG